MIVRTERICLTIHQKFTTYNNNNYYYNKNWCCCSLAEQQHVEQQTTLFRIKQEISQVALFH